MPPPPHPRIGFWGEMGKYAERRLRTKKGGVMLEGKGVEVHESIYFRCDD